MTRAPRLSLTLSLLLTATLTAACASQNNRTDTNDSHSALASSPLLLRPTAAPPAAANPTSPDHTAINLRPAAWTRAEPGAGTHLLIYYTTGGLPACNLLGRVNLVETTTTVTITILLGQAPNADCNGPQPMTATAYVTNVLLQHPLGTRTVRDSSN